MRTPGSPRGSARTGWRNDLRTYLNEAVLREVWRSLFLPVRVRQIWEERFPDLVLAA